MNHPTHNSPPEYRRSHEPVFWSLFGAGGVLAALVGPMLTLLLLVCIPLGLLLPSGTLSHARVLAFVQWWPGALAVLAVVMLFLFHGMHRIAHTAHDFGLPTGRWAAPVCYGFAGLMTAVCAWLLWCLQ